VVTDVHVSVAYRLLDAAGNVADEVSRAEPLCYVHGYGLVVPGLEEGLEGAKLGERRSIRCEPDMAFGERDPEAFLEIERSELPAEGAEIGDEIVATSPEGVEVIHRIVSLSDELVVVDLNHPLAGQVVTFDAEVCALRPASDDELDAAIVSAGTIVYGTRPPDDLVQLRRGSGDEEEP
jgi:FKBP-type peptidyl-prolyl cis-trans isomerase SlyD